MSTFYKCTSSLFILLFSLTFNCSTNTNQEDLEAFKFSIQNTEDGVVLKGINGTGWKNLSFTLKNNQTQAVDEYGMTEVVNQNHEKLEELSDFLFTVTKKENALLLKGIKGSDWTELSFTTNGNQAQMVDESGMTQQY